MFVRSLLFGLALAASALGQGSNRAPKPKVVAPAAPVSPAAPAAKPPLRKRPPAKPAADPADAPAPSAYLPKVKAAFAARWADALTPVSATFAAGNVSVLFTLDAEGKLTAFKVTENTSNEAFAKFCEKFVRETAFEKPPGKSLTDGSVEIPFTFWIY